MNTNQTMTVNTGVNIYAKGQTTTLFGELGVTILSTIVKKLSNINIFRDKEIPSEYMIKELEKSRRDVENGDVISFSTPEDALAYVDRIISARSK